MGRRHGTAARNAGSGVRDDGRCDAKEGVRADEDDVAKVSELFYVLVIDVVCSLRPSALSGISPELGQSEVCQSAGKGIGKALSP